jgi:adenylate cyclase
MALEIERKFLVDPDLWKPKSDGVFIRQGYLSSVKERVVRIRTAGAEASLTIKGLTQSFTRLEFEYSIPLDDAVLMLEEICEKPLIEKTRHRERVGDHIWEIDVFQGANQGLIIAEIELSREDEEILQPPWAVKEVSDDPRYYNANLAKTPFNTWGSSQ